MNITKRRWLRAIDKPFIVSVLLIIVLGLLILTSATINAVKDNPFYYLEKQLLLIGFSIILAYLILRIEVGQLQKVSWYVYGLALILLIVVLVFGSEQRGTTGWIGFGAAKIQPAEISKVLLITSFASFLARRQGELETLQQMLPAFLYVGVPFLLVMAQPDLGTGLVFLAILVGMMLVAGANPRVLLTLVGGAILLAVVWVVLHTHFGLWLPLKDYQLSRLTVFIDPYKDGMGGRGDGWNTIQSLVAIGSGGLVGKGLFHGTQAQLQFLPERHTDFIYAVLGEELGFIGAAGLIILYIVMTYRALIIALEARDLYSTLLVSGVLTMWLFHILENIGMSIGIMPVTGIPLPFVSYGGSAMLANFMGLALILGVNLRGRKILF
ncbi:MAG: rod shape-determining protein RodA [Methylocystaceae bacterium]